MTIHYPVGDFLIRLKNAAKVGHKELEAPATKLVVAVAETLKRAKYISEVKVEDNVVKVHFAYKSKKAVLMDVKLVSKLGLRIYKKIDELKKHRGASILILSTPKGVLTSREAIKENVGGEIIAEIW